MTPLKHKTILITGATSGFGRAMAELFAQEGARLIVTGRRAEKLAELQAAFPQTPMLARAFDIRDKDAVFALAKDLPAEFAQVDVLINNAGLALGIGRVPQIELDDWERMIDTNIKGLTYCTQAFLPGMLARGRGHIVNIGSIAGSYAYPGGNVYGGTKAFVRQFSQNLRADLLGSPVRVTEIAPGMAETEFSLVRFQGDAAKAKAVYEGVDPLTGQDIAEAALWAITRPAHVNINHIEIMPTAQASAGLAVARK